MCECPVQSGDAGFHTKCLCLSEPPGPCAKWISGGNKVSLLCLDLAWVDASSSSGRSVSVVGKRTLLLGVYKNQIGPAHSELLWTGASVAECHCVG